MSIICRLLTASRSQHIQWVNYSNISELTTTGMRAYGGSLFHNLMINEKRKEEGQNALLALSVCGPQMVWRYVWCVCVCTEWTLVKYTVRWHVHISVHWFRTGRGKIQGDGWKFLDRFKSYFGSQISSQSLNEIHICWLQPKSTTKGDFFSYIFGFDCQFESALVALWWLT